MAFTIFDGTETHDVLVESADASDYAKGTLVAYASIDAEGYLQDSENFGTVKSMTGNDKEQSAKDANINAGSNKADATDVISIDNNEMNVTADTQVIVVDSDADKADVPQNYTYGTTKLPKAADTGLINVVYRVEDGEAASDGADLELVVIDITGAFDFNRPDSTVDDGDDEDDTTTSGNVSISGLEGVKINKSRIADGQAQVILDVADAEVSGITGSASVKVDGVNAASDAVTTKFVSGQIQITVTDDFVTDSSKIVVDLSGITLTMKTYAVTGISDETITDSTASTKTFSVSADKASYEKDEKVTLTITLDEEVPADKVVTVKFTTPTGIADVMIAAGETEAETSFTMGTAAVTLVATATETSAS